MAHWERCVGSLGDMCWLIRRDVLAHLQRCGGSLEICGGLLGEMCWAHLKRGAGVSLVEIRLYTGQWKCTRRLSQ